MDTVSIPFWFARLSPLLGVIVGFCGRVALQVRDLRRLKSAYMIRQLQHPTLNAE